MRSSRGKREVRLVGGPSPVTATDPTCYVAVHSPHGQIARSLSHV